MSTATLAPRINRHPDYYERLTLIPETFKDWMEK